MAGPLAGVRVLDLTTVVVGPVCTRTLADQGADVIKVEAPSGDLLRSIAEGARHPGMSGKFINFNRGKRAVCLDLKQAAGRAVVTRLAARSDVFVSNMRPAALERLGFTDAALQAPNPRLICCAILAFGRGGRYFGRPAYDPIIQSLSGVAATLEHATGVPRFVPMVMSDHITGLIAAQSIGFALYRREQTGVGESIEVPMFENMAGFIAAEHLGRATFEPPLGPPGDGRLLSPEYRPLPTRDGFITVAPNTDAQAHAFFAAIGQPALRDDPRLATAAARTEHAQAYFDVRVAGLATKTTAEWLRIFEALDVPAARFNRLEDLPDDPHLRDVGFFETEIHPTEGPLRRPRVANRFSGGNQEDRRPAPRRGEQTREVLGELGYTGQEVAELLAAGAAVAVD